MNRTIFLDRGERFRSDDQENRNQQGRMYPRTCEII